MSFVATNTRFRGRRKTQLAPNLDFSGGLNIAVTESQLEENESPELLNVDLNPRGGFKIRNVVRPLNATALDVTPRNIWTYETPSVSQVIVQRGNDIAHSTGGNFTNANPDANTLTGRMRAVTFNDLNYVQRNAETTAFKWDGAAFTAISDPAVAGYADDFDAPSTNRMPKGKVVAAWRGYVWVANLVENATAKRNRIRWSHPNNPEAWRTNDFIDIDIGHDGDEITALMPANDRLLVFKRNSIHSIYGSGHNDFREVPLDQEHGALNQECVGYLQQVAYAFSWPAGLVAVLPNNQVANLFDKVRPLVTGERGDEFSIVEDSRNQVTLGVVQNRIYLSMPTNVDTPTNQNETYVFDPRIGAVDRRRRDPGAWMKFTPGFGPFTEWRPSGEIYEYLACRFDGAYVLKLEQEGTSVDDWRDNFGGGDVNILSFYRTRWFDAGSPSLRKRYKRTDFLLYNDNLYTLDVRVFRDYDPVTVARQFELVTDPTPLGGEWGVMQWGVGEWSRGEGRPHLLERASSLGAARAVSLQIDAPQTPTRHWGVDSINLKFILRVLR